ncbi:hypothetical protein F4819DRAFT_510030 [Hypoxylon fuscum]|nr:hypothetical protein F4819DRAFT_510030 [Hypoxylon fuscum]
MEKTQATQPAAILRKVAKKMAKNPQKSKNKLRRLEKLVYQKYKPVNVANGDPANTTVGAIRSPPNSQTGSDDSIPDNSVWDLTAFSNGQPAPSGVTLRMMLNIAGNCYKHAATDFDTMDLYQHIWHILQDMRENGQLQTEINETRITKSLISVAQHRKEAVSQSYPAFIANQAVLDTLRDQAASTYKTCKNCGEKFPFPTKVDAHGRTTQPKRIKGTCKFHSGTIQCWNAKKQVGMQEIPLNDKFLTHGDVRMKHFKFDVDLSYWNCCASKLSKPEPIKRSKSQRHVVAQEWEIPKRNDASVGCQILDYHEAADEPIPLTQDTEGDVRELLASTSFQFGY